MKKNFSRVLVASLATFASVMADCGKDTNLAHVKFRDYYALPYVQTGGASNMMMENGQRDDAVGGCFSAMAFWEQSICGSRGSQELAKGFGVNGSRSFAVNNTAAAGNVAARNLIHDSGAVNATTANVSLDAKHRRYGVNLQYSQCLSNFYEGLKFKVSSAALGVRNELVNRYDDETTAAGKTSVKQFFRGESLDTVLTSVNAQAPLKFGKMSDKENTQYHFNDVQACVGLTVVVSDNANVCVGISGVLPVGRELNGEFLMEPQVGNRHFKLGSEVDVYACLSEGADYKAAVNVNALWHYAFKRENVRLPSHNSLNYGHYHLGYRKDTAGAGTSALEPIMNLVSKKVDVKPGSVFDLSACLNFEKGCLSVDAGYNFFYSQAESNSVCNFVDGDLFIVPAVFDNAAVAHDGTNGAVVAVKASDLNYNASSQALHHIFASVGFVCKDWSYPASVNVAGGYEFAHNRSRTREVWSVAVKGSVCF
jgi:hypothetical protein